MSSTSTQGGSPFVPGALVAGKYRLIKQLGEGAMGVVWSAVNQVTLGEVALKLIWKPEPEYRVRLLREAKACGTVRHKNVIQIHDVSQTDGGDPFLVMELLSGETLGELLSRKRRLPPAEAAGIARDVARGLAAAHAKGIVHRDLKPANIFLHNEPGDDFPVVKVLDFGVAKNLFVNDGLRTAAGGTVGSPMYMSPEQARKERDIDGRADIWSLGVVLFEMLTGERPFTGDLAEVLLRIQEGDIPTVGRRIRKIDPDLDAIVAGCLVRNREERIGPATEVARLLDEHAAPGGRDPLPSLVEESLSDRIAAGAATTGAAAFSPGFGPTGLQPSSSSPRPAGFEPRPSGPGQAPSGIGPASSQGRAAALSPSGSFPAAPLTQTGSGAVTEQLGAAPVPRTSGVPADPDDAMATRKLEPRVLSPRNPVPAPGGGGVMGPSGTMRIDADVVEAALAARGATAGPVAPLPAPPTPAPPSGAAGAFQMPLQRTLPLGMVGPVPAAGGTVSSTAPMLRSDSDRESVSPAGVPKSNGLKIAIAIGAIGGVALAAAVLFFIVFPAKSPANPTPATQSVSATAAPVPTSSVAATVTATSSAEPAPSASATTTATSPQTPGTTPAKSSAPAGSSTSPRPALTGKKPPPPPPKPCNSFDPKCKKEFKGL